MIKSIIARLRFQTIGQLIILGLIVTLFVYGKMQLQALSRLSNNTKITSEITQSLYRYNQNKDSLSLQNALNSINNFEYINKEKEEKFLLDIKKYILQIDSMHKLSYQHELEVEALIANSVKQSDSYIKQTSKRLIDEKKRANVSNAERGVLIGALSNTNTNHQISELYYQIGKKGISDSLKKLVDFSIRNARIQEKNLRGTDLVNLSRNALKSNRRLKNILNLELKNAQQIKLLAEKVINKDTELNIEMQADTKKALNDNIAGFSFVNLIILLVILIFSLLMAFFSNYLSKDLSKHIKVSLDAYRNLSEAKYETKNLQLLSSRKDEIGILAKRLINLIKKIETNSKRTAKSVSIIRQTSEELDTASENLSQNTAEEAASMEENSSAIEEMTANLEIVAVNAGDVQKTVAQTNNKVQIITKVVESTGVSLKNSLAKSLVIKDISHKVDILSINAAIEAARAGNAGLGFSVIAEEIRKLSDLVQQSATEIEELAIKGQKHADQSILVAKGFVPEMRAVVDKMNDLMISIDEIKSGAGQISSSTTQLNSSTQANAQLAEELTQKAAQIRALAEDLKFGRELFEEEIENEKNKKKGNKKTSELEFFDKEDKEKLSLEEKKEAHTDFMNREDINDTDFEKF